MKKSSIRIALIALALCALVGGICYYRGGHDEERSSEQPRRARLARKGARSAKSGRQKVGELLGDKVKVAKPDKTLAAQQAAPAPRQANPAKMFSRMKPASRKDAMAIQSALDDKDFDAVRALVDMSLRSDDPDLRGHMVDALSWFGAAALPELTAFLSDGDPEVAESAADAWQQALSEVEDETLKAQTAQAAMTMLTNADTLTMLMAEITSVGDDLVSMQAIVDTILDGTEEAVKVAKEGYEDLTGEKWRGVEAAEAWLQENYDPPEKDDDEDEKK